MKQDNLCEDAMEVQFPQDVDRGEAVHLFKLEKSPDLAAQELNMDDKIQGASHRAYVYYRRRKQQRRGQQRIRPIRKNNNCVGLTHLGKVLLLFTLMIASSLLDERFTFWNVGRRRCIFAQAAQADEVFYNGHPFGTDPSCWELPLSEERNKEGQSSYWNTSIDSSNWLPLTTFAISNAKGGADDSLQQLYDMELDPTTTANTTATPITHARAKPLDRCLGG
jgi:hypothetical protein